MAKDAFYFPHDSNAHNDPKCSALISEFGLEGYGAYWMLIETMHEQGGKIEKFPKMIDGLAFSFKMEKQALLKLIEALVEDFCLLKDDENFIWSDRVLRNLEERQEKRNAKVEAGRLGGIRSSEARKTSKHQALLEASQAPLEANQPKERKGKEIKEEEGQHPQNPPIPTNVFSGIEDALEKNDLAQALEKLQVSDAEYIIWQGLRKLGCNFEDVKKAKALKKKNSLSYLKDVVCEFRDKRNGPKDESEWTREDYRAAGYDVGD